MKRHRAPPFIGEADLSCLCYLACSFLAAYSCFKAILRGLSTAGRFLTSSVASRLSSEGSESLPLLESPIPIRSNSLLFYNSAIKVYLIFMACWLTIIPSPSEGGSAENVFPMDFLVLIVGIDASS